LSASAELLVILGPFGLKLPIHANFGEFWDMTALDGVLLGIGYRCKGLKKLECWGYQTVEKVLR